MFDFRVKSKKYLKLKFCLDLVQVLIFWLFQIFSSNLICHPPRLDLVTPPHLATDSLSVEKTIIYNQQIKHIDRYIFPVIYLKSYRNLNVFCSKSESFPKTMNFNWKMSFHSSKYIISLVLSRGPSNERELFPNPFDLGWVDINLNIYRYLLS